MVLSGTNYVLNEPEDVDQLWLIFNTIQDNAMLQLSCCKFGGSKWNPYWFIVLTSSSATNHIPNKHEDVDQYDPYGTPSKIMPAMLKLSCKFGESNWNPRWASLLTSSSGTLNGHTDVGPYAIPSKLMPCHSYTAASLVNQSEITIELSCSRAHLGLIMSLRSIKMLTNITHMPHHPR